MDAYFSGGLVGVSASAPDFSTLAADCCRVFLGWRLREDRKALLSIGEGLLEIDIRNAEAWCDGEPLPPLFIAGELQRELEKALAVWEFSEAQLSDARLSAEFAVLTERAEGQPALQITCETRFVVDGVDYRASLHNRTGG